MRWRGCDDRLGHRGEPPRGALGARRPQAARACEGAGGPGGERRAALAGARLPLAPRGHARRGHAPGRERSRPRQRARGARPRRARHRRVARARPRVDGRSCDVPRRPRGRGDHGGRRDPRSPGRPRAIGREPRAGGRGRPWPTPCACSSATRSRSRTSSWRRGSDRRVSALRQRRRLLRERLSDLVVPVVALQLALLGLAIAYAPAFGLAALVCLHTQVLVVTWGTALSPRDRLLSLVARFLVDAASTFGPAAPAPAAAGSNDELASRLRRAPGGGHRALLRAASRGLPAVRRARPLQAPSSSATATSTSPGASRSTAAEGCRHVFQNPRLSIDGLDFYYNDFYDGLGEERLESIFALDPKPYRRARADGGRRREARALARRRRRPRPLLLRRARAAPDDALRRPRSQREHRRRRKRAAGSTAATAASSPTSRRSSPGPRYDVVSMSHYLEHTLDPRAEIAAAARAPAEGGLLFIEVPDPECRARAPPRRVLDAVVPAAAPALRERREPRAPPRARTASRRSRGTAARRTSASTSRSSSTRRSSASRRRRTCRGGERAGLVRARGARWSAGRASRRSPRGGRSIARSGRCSAGRGGRTPTACSRGGPREAGAARGSVGDGAVHVGGLELGRVAARGSSSSTRGRAASFVRSTGRSPSPVPSSARARRCTSRCSTATRSSTRSSVRRARVRSSSWRRGSRAGASPSAQTRPSRTSRWIGRT